MQENVHKQQNYFSECGALTLRAVWPNSLNTPKCCKNVLWSEPVIPMGSLQWSSGVYLDSTVMPRLHTPAQQVACNKLRATCCLKQHVAHNTQLVAGNKQLAARNKLRWCKRGIRDNQCGPQLGLIWTVMLVWRKGNINRTVFTLHNHNEQFFQVGLLDWALISLGLALSPPSTSVSSDFMVLYKCFFKIILTSLYLVEGLVWWDWPLTWWTDQLLSFRALTLLVGSSDP